MKPANFPYRLEIKRREAIERKEAYEALSLEDKIRFLDRRLGPGVGAVKQRARLAKLIATPAPVVEEPMTEAPKLENTEPKVSKRKSSKKIKND